MPNTYLDSQRDTKILIKSTRYCKHAEFLKPPSKFQFLFWSGALFYNAVIRECQMVGLQTNCKGFERKCLYPDQGIIPPFAWRD
jgi:hypothetical protein